MTYWTDYAENKIIDKVRGTEPTYPSNWYIGLLSAAADGSVTEVTGANLARVAYARNLGNWSGTQGLGTTVASNGASHTTQNNNAINFAAASGALAAPATFVGLFDALSEGHCWAYAPITSRVVGLGDAPSIDVGELAFIVGQGNGCSNYLSNKLVDEFFRGQAYPWPATIYGALYSASPGNADTGTEIATGGYARAPLVASMANLSGTQAAGSTGASSGTGGKTSNNVAVTWPNPSADYTIVANGWRDASSGGNLLLWGNFASPRSIQNAGAAPSYAPATLSFSFL